MVARPAHRIGVCADDVGLVPGAAETAWRLGAAGHLTAASCVTNGRWWANDGPWLAACRSEPGSQAIEFGLHLNLTEGTALSLALRRHWPVLPGLGGLMALAGLGQLPLQAIGDEWRAQLAAFCDVFGREPDFIDGHQHVHHLRGVRDAVLAGIAAMQGSPAVRNTGRLVGPGSPVRRLVIEASGGRTLMRRLSSLGIRHNTALFGTYGFAGVDYRSLVRDWLVAAPPSGGLLYCHPCVAPAGATANPDTDARAREADYLGGELFEQDLMVAGVELGSPWILVPPALTRTTSID